VKLFLIIAIIAVIALVAVALQRPGLRITRIDRRIERDGKDGDR
jgi:hypothetical protein